MIRMFAVLVFIAISGRAMAGETSSLGATSVVLPLCPVVLGFQIPTVDEAVQFIGNTPYDDRKGIAVKYLRQMDGASPGQLADTFRVFITAIKNMAKADGMKWSALEYRACDGSVVFMGDKGHALIIAPNSKLYQAKLSLQRPGTILYLDEIPMTELPFR